MQIVKCVTSVLVALLLVSCATLSSEDRAAIEADMDATFEEQNQVTGALLGALLGAEADEDSIAVELEYALHTVARECTSVAELEKIENDLTTRMADLTTRMADMQAAAAP